MKCITNILSLGVGVQSSTLLLMALHQETEYSLDAAIFSDTQCEGKRVYKWFSELKEIVGGKIKIIECTKGNLMNDALSLKKSFSSMPLFIIGIDGKRAMIKRQCTNEYKIEPVRKEISKLINAQYSKHKVLQWLGISTDELSRMKLSRVQYIQNYFPLVEEKRMSRFDCIKWLIDKGYPIPPKSSCIICPFHSDEYWQDLKENEPDEFEQACVFDEAIRWSLTRFKLKSPAFLHSSLKPLRDVDFTRGGQSKLFPSLECSGTCFT